MDVTLRLSGFRERSGVVLLNWLTRHNARVLEEHRAQGRPLPLLYDSGVVYRREPVELWSDVVHVHRQGHEDCDALAPARAGELLAYGHEALRPGDGGFAEARRLRLPTIQAEAMMTTRVPRGGRGLYHVVVRYRVGNRWFRDDPSARLGMYGGRVDRGVLARWRQAGVRARAPLEV